MRERILIADDDPAILEGLHLILDEEDYAVTAMPRAPKIADVVRIDPALILLDIWLSGDDGRDICRELKSDERTRRIPVALISANPDTARIATACGADDFLTKPFDMDDLLDLAHRHVRA